MSLQKIEGTREVRDEASGILVPTLLSAVGVGAVAQHRDTLPPIPRTWDDAEIASLKVPLANAAASPKQVTADDYYRMPVRPIYKGYPVYALATSRPVISSGSSSRSQSSFGMTTGMRRPLQTEADWIRAGEMVFDAPPGSNRFFRIEDVRNPRLGIRRLGARVSKDGVLPAFQYVVKAKGVVELGALGCATCHTRVMPDGSILKGAQGNQPLQRAAALGMRAGVAASHDANQYLAQLRGLLKSIHGAPWLRPDPEARIDTMSVAEIADVFDAVPPGTSLRQGTNSFLPMQVPDLIGVKDRRYLDHTGLERHRDIVDFMRYSAVNQGTDMLASYAGFVPADVPRFTERPAPETVRVTATSSCMRCRSMSTRSRRRETQRV